MEKELGPEVIKATQASLGKYVKRPPLSDKLLKKPPFRFLHDIITSVLKTSGFFEGLFDEEELVSENVKDRDSKILFLNKVISVVSLTTGKSLSAKPSKIVAGQEPEKTNELLQSIAYALDKKLSSEEAVKKFKDNSIPPQPPEPKPKEKPVKKANDTKKLTSRSSEKLVGNKKESTAVNKNDKSKPTDPKSRKKDTAPNKIDNNKTEPPTKKPQNLKTVGKKSSVESITQPVPTETPKSETQEQQLSIPQKDAVLKEAVAVQEIIKTNSKYQEDIINQEKESTVVREDDNESHVVENQGQLNSSYTIVDNEHNSSLSSQDLMEVNHDKLYPNKSFEIPVTQPDETPEDRVKEAKVEISRERKGDDSLKKNSNFKENEESSFSKKPRPALIPKHNSLDSEEKIKELMRNNSQDNPVARQTPEVVRPASVRPSSSRPGAPRLREKLDIVIPDSESLLLGKVNIIAENSQNEEDEESSVIIVEQHALGPEAGDSQAMQLSANEHGHLVHQILNSQKELSQNTGKTEIEWQYGQKAKEASSQEIEQLRYSIQALSRVANPLGKLLDHVQEDVQVMRQELQQWSSVYQRGARDMAQQRAESDKALLPLQTRVKQLDVDIEEKRDKINDIKILIHKNTARIDKLLANGNVQ